MDQQQSEFLMGNNLRQRELILKNHEGNFIQEEPEDEDKYNMADDFTQNCSMHGIRNIFKDGTGTWYRLLWIVLLLSCIGVSLVQIVDRVIYYLKWPVTVNLAINYNTTLLFPAITFCNQNRIRATAAYNLKWYRLMEDLYNDQLSKQKKLDAVQKYGAANMTLDEIFGPVAHSKEDMIITCKWGHQICGPENFTAIWTSLGLCFTFNFNATNQLNVIASGADNGLQLTLNVEEYEYMLETEGGAGIRVLLHNPQDFPDVKELGFASPSGTHSFIGLKVVEISSSEYILLCETIAGGRSLLGRYKLRNLPKPPASCQQRKLEFFDEYSTSTCKLECSTNLMAKTCGCRLIYMPGKIDGVPVCNLSQYINCYLPEKENIHAAQRTCQCPLPCKVLLFDPSVSLATHSDNKIKKLLASKHISQIKRKFHAAREVTERMIPTKMRRMQRLILNLNNTLRTVRHMVENELFDAISVQLHSIENVTNATEALYEGQTFLYDYQKYIVQKNFARVREAMDERTFTYITFNFFDFLYTLEDWLRSLANTEQFSSPASRMTTYFIIRDTINAKMNNIRMAKGNFSELHNSLLTGIGIFRYKYLDIPRSYNEFATPISLLTRRLNRSSTHHTRIPKTLNVMLDELQMFSGILNDTWTSGIFDEEHFRNISQQYIISCRGFNGAASIFKSLTTEYAISVLDIRKSYLDLRMRTFRQVASDMKYLLSSLRDLLVHLQSRSFQNVFSTFEQVTGYLLSTNTSKMALADLLLEETHANDMSRLNLFFEELRHKDMSVHEKWDELADAAVAVWDRVLRETESRRYHEFTNNTHLLRNLTDVEKELKEEYMTRKNTANLDVIIGSEIENLFMWHDEILQEVMQFKESTIMNEKFVASNLLDLGIFYKQLSYEIITDQEAYGIFALFCNIGGTMGLLLGASVLTLSEVVEVSLVCFFLCVCRKLRACCQKRTSRRQKIAEL